MDSSQSGRVVRRTIAVYRVAYAVMAIVAAVGATGSRTRQVSDLLTRISLHGPAWWRESLAAAGAAYAHQSAALAAALGAIAAMHLAEAWGLWQARRWASWLAIASAGSFLPLEAALVLKHADALLMSVMLGNLAIVGWLARDVLRRRSATSEGIGA